MAQAKARDKSVDFAKGIAMIAVSFGHIMPALYGNVDIISKYCSSFELAVFFIASGYLQFGRTERKPREYIIHSAKSLIYPYLTFSIVLFVLTSATSILNDGLRAFWDELPVTISLAVTWGEGACWFFPTFFVSGIIAYFCRRDSKIPSIVKTVVMIVVGAVLCVISEKYGFLREATQSGITQPLFWLWHLLSFISRSIVGASLMMIGCRLKRLAIICAEKPRGGYILSAVLISIGLVTCYFNYDFVDLHFAFIRNPILFYISAVSTTYALLIIGKKFFPACIVWCGRESLLLMLAQTGMVDICIVIKKFINTPELPYAVVLIIAVVVLIVSLIISYFVIMFIHSTFLKILIIPPEKRKGK